MSLLTDAENRKGRGSAVLCSDQILGTAGAENVALKAVADVLQKDPGYFSWMLAGDFTNDTKQVLTRIRLKEYNAKK